MKAKSIAVVRFSGGQDSTTCLYWARDRFERVVALSIHYGQRHAVEVEAARTIAAAAGVEHEVLEVGRILRGTSPLVSDAPVGQYASANDLPGGVEPTFVPARNALFLVLAANVATVLGSRDLVTGVCEADFGGYPDCRRDFIDAMERTLGLGIDGDAEAFRVHTPLMYLTKADTVRLAQALPGCMEALADSHTCYRGERPPCGKCHACIIRARGFDEVGVVDPISGQ
jgi:7-cyano-7-deazaguanine synthase